LGGKGFAVIVVLGITLGLLNGMLNIEPSFAKGYAEIECPHPSAKVVFIETSTDDPPGTVDPGYDKDVASCRAKVWRGALVFVSICNGYPSYTCTFSTTIYNSGTLPVRLESQQFKVPPELTVTALEGLPGLVLEPGQQAVQAFSVHVEQEAEQRARYRFRIGQLFHVAE